MNTINNFRFIIISLGSTIFTSCIGQNNGLQDLINVNNFSTIELNINNGVCDSVGYEVWNYDEDVGVKSINIHKDFLYLTDVYHNSIKKVSIKSGNIESNICLSKLPASESGIWLRDITVFNNKVYVTGDRDSVYVFSLDLKLEKVIPVSVGYKNIYKMSPDSLLIYLDSEQLPNLNFKYELLLVTSDHNYSLINKIVSLNDYEKERRKTTINGEEYKLLTNSDKPFIEIPRGVIELKTEIPNIDEYGAKNIDFSKNYLIYFSSSKEKIIFYIYHFD